MAWQGSTLIYTTCTGDLYARIMAGTMKDQRERDGLCERFQMRRVPHPPHHSLFINPSGLVISVPPMIRDQ
jgi:hypothetical protein